MLKTHGTLRLKRSPERERKRIIWSATFQVILQTLSLAVGAVIYHNTFFARSMSESYEQGYSRGYGHAHDLYAPKTKRMPEQIESIPAKDYVDSRTSFFWVADYNHGFAGTNTRSKSPI